MIITWVDMKGMLRFQDDAEAETSTARRISKTQHTISSVVFALLWFAPTHSGRLNTAARKDV